MNARKQSLPIDAADDLAFASIEELAVLLARRKISPVELVTLFLRRIERHNPALNAFLTITRASAFADAKVSEKLLLRRRSRGPLEGIPIAIKDNLYTQGVRTTAGAKFLRDFIPQFDATTIARLRSAGAILLGKTNLHEFAYGITTGNPHFGATHNPWDLERIPGGSSGGSAAAISAGLCAASIGTDTGGSIRIPASLCGIFGIKPSFGRVSCYGSVPLAPSLDHVGPLTRSAADAALLLGAISGADPHDTSTLAQPNLKPFLSVSAISSRLRSHFTKKHPLRLGWSKDYFFDAVDPEVVFAMDAAARSFEGLGAVIEEVSLPHIREGDAPSTAIALAEATHVHEAAGWFPAHASDYGEDVRKRLELGRDVRAADYLAALDARKRVRADFEGALERVDAILAPATPIAAPRIGENVVLFGSTEETIRSALIRTNRPANLTCLPALSTPCGWTQSGLPVGLQLIGKQWGEERLLTIARLFEQAHPEYRRRPPGF
ncbi:MAG TPA: amidase [Candidatus Acidoferrales bacterium]|nr:amidase [Candidatus Acidoferrales bacterium]